MSKFGQMSKIELSFWGPVYAIKWRKEITLGVDPSTAQIRAEIAADDAVRAWRLAHPELTGEIDP